ncbi:Programmed cell death 6-interacting protein, partial [Geodia barretti]
SLPPPSLSLFLPLPLSFLFQPPPPLPLPQSWLATASAKTAYFHCVAQHRLGLVAQAGKNYGEAVARMKKAVELLGEAEKKGEGVFKPYEVTQTVKKDFEAANKDNNFIYNDLVPDFGTLEPPGKATLAKPLPFTSPAPNFIDLFANLVPLAVSQALQAYGTKKDDLVNTECERLRGATAELNELLASKNLPAAIEDTGGDSLPESLQEKAAAVAEAGGARALEEKLNAVPELVQRNREILTETVRMMDEEEREDSELRSRFREKWSRQPSASLAENLRKEVTKYKTILDTASGADQTVRQKFESHREAVVLLGKQVAEIQAAVPKAGALSPRVQGSQCVQDLRGLMEEVMTLKAEREVIERTLRENIADITGKFLKALKDFGDVDEETISEAHLRTEYGSVQTQVQESIGKQPGLVQRIAAASAQFEQLTGGQSVGEREGKLKELATGYDAFQQLQSNITEGIKFYNDLTPLLVRVQSKISDFVFARRTEKDDLLKDLQKTIANQPYVAPPENPQYQQQSRQPPQRPPPPQAAPRPPPPQQMAPPTAPPHASGAPPPHQMGGHPYHPQMPPAQSYQPYAPYGAPPPQPHPGYYQQPPPGPYYAPHPGAPYGQPPHPGMYGNPPAPYGQPPPGQYHPQQPYRPPPSHR